MVMGSPETLLSADDSMEAVSVFCPTSRRYPSDMEGGDSAESTRMPISCILSCSKEAFGGQGCRSRHSYTPLPVILREDGSDPA